MSENTEIRMKKSDMVQRVNYVLCTIGECKDDVIKAIFNSKCAHFYGCQSWNLSDKHVKEFQTMWNQCIRRLLKLPNYTLLRFLPICMNSLSALEQVQSRFVNLVQTMLKSDNGKVKFLCELSIKRANSLIGTNLRMIANKLQCDIDVTMSLSPAAMKKKIFNSRNDRGILCTLQILELRHCYLPGFTQEEVYNIFLHLCTM